MTDTARPHRPVPRTMRDPTSPRRGPSAPRRWAPASLRRALPSADDDRGWPRRRRPPGRWRVVLWRARLPFAALMVGCAVALGLADLRPAPPPSTPVVVAARALGAGEPVDATDLTVARLPPEAVPDGAHASPEAVVGSAAVVPVPAGLPLVDALLRDDRLGSTAPSGTVVAPVRLADPGVAELLRPGDRVDLFAAATTGSGEPVAERLARRALVLPHPRPHGGPSPASTGLLGAGPDDGGTLTLVAVAPEQAAALAGASAWAGISAVVVE